MRIPDGTLKSVCFLGVKLSGGKTAGKFYSFGTGFFVGIHQQGYDFPYLITAKHVLDEAQRGGYSKLVARFNKIGGGTGYVDLLESKMWIRWENPAIDVAVLPLALDSRIFDYSALPEGMMLDGKKLGHHGIGVGDDLFAIGLFVLKSGNQRNIPIVRTGVIAAMPEQSEPFTSKDKQTYHAYLAEMRSIGGLSGSPVFVFLDRNRLVDAKIPEGHEWGIFFLGLIRGHWDLDRDVSGDVVIDAAMGFSKGENLNTGIAVVTPSQYVLGILNNPKMQQQRADFIKQKESESTPTDD